MVGNKKEHIKIPSETADIAACIQNELGIHSAITPFRRSRNDK